MGTATRKRIQTAMEELHYTPNALVRAIPLRRLAQPSEIADAIAFFASSRSTFITGQVLSVSGGLTMVG